MRARARSLCVSLRPIRPPLPGANRAAAAAAATGQRFVRGESRSSPFPLVFSTVPLFRCLERRKDLFHPTTTTPHPAGLFPGRGPWGSKRLGVGEARGASERGCGAPAASTERVTCGSGGVSVGRRRLRRESGRCRLRGRWRAKGACRSQGHRCACGPSSAAVDMVPAPSCVGRGDPG